jgi:solute carrier family 6 GABA transporter-like protein 6/8/11/12/13
LKPDLQRLSDYQVWLDAATQVFFSYALVKGMLVTMGSYNNYKYNSYRDCIFLSILNCGVCFVSGFAIFAVLGFMAKEQQVDIKVVAESGPGLAFIAYPKALTLMPLPQFWGVLFFFMLFLLGLDSEFVGLETMIATFVDLNPRFFDKPWRREKVLAGLCTLQFLIGVTMVTNGGVYILNIFDNYAAAGWSLLFLGFCECIAMAWLFGIDKFWDIVCDMIGFRPRFPLFKWCWAFITPVCTAILMFLMLAFYKPLTYNKTYTYPTWAIVICWLLTMSSVLWVPGYAAYQFFFKSRGNTWSEKWKDSITSNYISAGRAESIKQKEQAMDIEISPIEYAPLYQDIVNKV